MIGGSRGRNLSVVATGPCSASGVTRLRELAGSLNSLSDLHKLSMQNSVSAWGYPFKICKRIMFYVTMNQVPVEYTVHRCIRFESNTSSTRDAVVCRTAVSPYGPVLAGSPGDQRCSLAGINVRGVRALHIPKGYALKALATLYQKKQRIEREKLISIFFIYCMAMWHWFWTDERYCRGSKMPRSCHSVLSCTVTMS